MKMGIQDKRRPYVFLDLRVKPEDDKPTPILVQFHLISNGGQRIVLVFNKVHCLAHKNLPPATFYLRSPVKTGIQDKRRPYVFLDLRVKPEDDRGE